MRNRSLKKPEKRVQRKTNGFCSVFKSLYSVLCRLYSINMDSLSDALKHRLDRHGLDQAISMATHLETTRRILPSFVNPKSLRAGVLSVDIDTGAHAYFFGQNLEDTVESINAAIGKPLVTEIRIRINHT